jgi:hypothetical protein
VRIFECSDGQLFDLDRFMASRIEREMDDDDEDIDLGAEIVLNDASAIHHRVYIPAADIPRLREALKADIVSSPDKPVLDPAQSLIDAAIITTAVLMYRAIDRLANSEMSIGTLNDLTNLRNNAREVLVKAGLITEEQA